MTGREPVDFVVEYDGTSDDPIDEELVQPGARSLRPLWALGGALVVATAAFGIANRADEPTVASPSPSPSLEVFTPPPDVIGLNQPVRVPEGNRSARPLPGCPADASCYTNMVMPDETVRALRRDFPSAQLTSAVSFLANRRGRSGPDLVSRRLQARAGSVDITVTVRKPRRGDRDGYGNDRTGPLLHSVDTYAGSAFTVTVEIVQLGPKHRPSRSALDRIARDARLVEPQ